MGEPPAQTRGGRHDLLPAVLNAPAQGRSSARSPRPPHPLPVPLLRRPVLEAPMNAGRVLSDLLATGRPTLDGPARPHAPSRAGAHSPLVQRGGSDWVVAAAAERDRAV